LLLEGNKTLFEFEQKPNTTYQIGFINECGDHCDFSGHQQDPDETKRNDFHFNREALNLPAGEIQKAMM